MKKKGQKGFTLIELLVSLFIFSLIIGGVINSLLTSVTLQRRIIADQKMFAELSYTLEYMSRTLRMARKDINGTCTGTRNHNYTLLEGGNTIRFLNFDNECQEFSLRLIGNVTSTSERIATSSNSTALPSTFIPLTSANVTVTRLEFNNAGSAWHSPAMNQSKIAISLVVRPRIGGSEMAFQTVVSQRKLNVPY